MINFCITETKDYERLVPFFIENDLEFPEEEDIQTPTDLVKLWKVTEGMEADEDSAEYKVGVCDNVEAICSCDDASSCAGVGAGGRKKLIGGFVLAKREGEFIVDGIAVDPEYRKYKIGKTLLNKGIEETLRLGGKRIYLVARAPEFFKKSGFVTIPREEAPNFFECLTCPQYGVDCHPEVMRLELA